MSKATREFFENLKQPEGQEAKPMGVVEALREAVAAVAPGLTLENVWNGIKEEAVQQVQHGAHELAAALYSPGNSGFVMYPRTGKHDQDQDHGPGVHGPQDAAQALVERLDQPSHGLHEGQQQPQQERDQGFSM